MMMGSYLAIPSGPAAESGVGRALSDSCPFPFLGGVEGRGMKKKKRSISGWMTGSYLCLRITSLERCLGPWVHSCLLRGTVWYTQLPTCLPFSSLPTTHPHTSSLLQAGHGVMPYCT